jgi:hypothetical protein
MVTISRSPSAVARITGAMCRGKITDISSNSADRLCEMRKNRTASSRFLLSEHELHIRFPQQTSLVCVQARSRTAASPSLCSPCLHPRALRSIAPPHVLAVVLTPKAKADSRSWPKTPTGAGRVVFLKSKRQRHWPTTWPVRSPSARGPIANSVRRQAADRQQRVRKPRRLR